MTTFHYYYFKFLFYYLISFILKIGKYKTKKILHLFQKNVSFMIFTLIKKTYQIFNYQCINFCN